MNGLGVILFALLVFVIGVVATAIITFAIVTTYICAKRRIPKKYHYAGFKDGYSFELNTSDIDAPPPNGIDGQTAMSDFIVK